MFTDAHRTREHAHGNFSKHVLQHAHSNLSKHVLQHAHGNISMHVLQQAHGNFSKHVLATVTVVSNRTKRDLSIIIRSSGG